VIVRETSDNPYGAAVWVIVISSPNVRHRSDQVSNYPDYGRECLTSVVTETLLQVNLGHGVLVNASNLQLVSRQDPKKTTYTMCEVLFTRSELANSSLTGKRSNAFKDKAIKEKLDEARVQALAGALGFLA